MFLDARSIGLDRHSKARAEQVRAVSVERVGHLLGILPGELTRQLDEALRLHLAL